MIRDLKEECKKLALEIKQTKIRIKEMQKKGEYAGANQYALIFLKRDYRHRHIAYCLLRGRKIEEIEKKTREENKPNQTLIQEIIDAHREVIQDVRLSA